MVIVVYLSGMNIAAASSVDRNSSNFLFWEKFYIFSKEKLFFFWDSSSIDREPRFKYADAGPLDYIILW